MKSVTIIIYPIGFLVLTALILIIFLIGVFYGYYACWNENRNREEAMKFEFENSKP